MVVVFEFFGSEPIENVITCMNYKVDKVIYFGYHEAILSRKKTTSDFLRNYCGVGQTVFWEVSSNDLQSVINTMKKEIDREVNKNNDIFVDVTGGESLIFVAFGMLAEKYSIPMHMFDVMENRLIALSNVSIEDVAKKQSIKLDIDSFVALKGGSINYKMHKDNKDICDDIYIKDVDNLWGVVKRHIDTWNPFSDVMRYYLKPDDELNVEYDKKVTIEKICSSPNNLREEEFNIILGELADIGLINRLDYSGINYKFSYKNDEIKALIWEGGSVLEIYTCQKYTQDADECKAGLHIDWDCIVQDTGEDVVNEIDVLSIKNNIPEFISCKSGRMGKKQAMNALYELETIRKRFGGKYAKITLVTTQPLSRVSLLRAKEMKIDVQTI